MAPVSVHGLVSTGPGDITDSPNNLNNLIVTNIPLSPREAFKKSNIFSSVLQDVKRIIISIKLFMEHYIFSAMVDKCSRLSEVHNTIRIADDAAASL